MRFLEDGAQQSGNGWLQHSAGTWSYHTDSALLYISNANGLRDPFGPFKVQIWPDSMRWERMEEGDTVRIHLGRTSQIPTRPADHLYGLWSLESTSLAGTDLTRTLDPLSRQTLFFRWDQRFVMTNGEGKRRTGIYVPHGHRPWLELVFNGDETERQYWAYEVSDSTLSLSQEIEEVTYRERYVRIHEFPE
jgi:hypothetical protein